VIDDDPRIGSLKKREHVRHLVGLDLEIDEHAQVGQFGQQPGGLGVVLHAQQRRVEGHAAYPQSTQPFEFTTRHVVGYDRLPRSRPSPRARTSIRQRLSSS
jgi:hypothetical protein